jgi:hypothetical protein
VAGTLALPQRTPAPRICEACHWRAVPLRRYQRIHSVAVEGSALLQKGKESFKGNGLVSE